ncbi:hypothetical protein [Hyphomicrobium sp. MC1]|uniref:hypothetical protein n=1 Tax=Hyphomicrobium sp. (strain MC1) TaxID=717785 RepID=UPI000213EADF|nr:hypothetical protein [Hyphomicrobium sp. MC1]CCB64086.1 exported protein of unknown function [Hyphomicrobium sp. MC1]
MSVWRTTILTAALAIAWAAPTRADECDALAANVHAQNPEIAVAERNTQDQSVVVALKADGVDELTVTCVSDVDKAPELTAKANATWPSSDFYDHVSSAGAIVMASSRSAIRSGSVLCAQRAMASDDNNAIYDINGDRFECRTTSGVGGSTLIRISKLKTSPSPQ